MIKVAINGLGRIGRLMLRQWLQQQHTHIEIVAVNDLVDGDSLAYLMKYDSVHGRLSVDTSFKDNRITAGDRSFAKLEEPDPNLLPWQSMGVDLVVECTGMFRKREEAARHLEAGAKKVLISAPAEADFTWVPGVNDAGYQSDRHQIVSNASCTTNSMAPVLKVLSDNFGIEHCTVTTVHAYTISQSIVDKPIRKKIRGRAGAINIIPTSTGADKAVVEVMPELAGRLKAMALRVPVPDGSITDFNVTLSQDVTADAINQALQQAAQGPMRNILEYSEEELVSTDIVGNPHSGIVHALSTSVIQNRVAKLQVWYDNEYGYSKRLLETTENMAKGLL